MLAIVFTKNIKEVHVHAWPCKVDEIENCCRELIEKDMVSRDVDTRLLAFS